MFSQRNLHMLAFYFLYPHYILNSFEPFSLLNCGTMTVLATLPSGKAQLKSEMHYKVGRDGITITSICFQHTGVEN